MEKERKQDLGGPEEEALEQHVREMLDVNEPEVPKVPAEPLPTEATPKPTKIAIVHHEDEPTPGAPEVPTKKSSKKATKIAVTHDEADIVEEPAEDAALTEAIAETNQALTEQVIGTAPLVGKEAKKVTITHFEDTVPKDEESTPAANVTVEEPIAPEVTPEVAVPTEAPTESPLEPELESVATEQAVNDIIATDSDELLAAKDNTISQTASVKPAKQKRSSLFKKSGFWWMVAFLVMAGIIAVALYPMTRYAVLNAAGVRSSASVHVLDQSTQQPLKGVTVTLAGQTAQTDGSGTAHLSQLRLGPTELIVQKRAFAISQQAETIGWGSNPLADITLTPTGSQYAFTVTDAVSGQPITIAEASVGDSDALADSKGVITLTLDKKSDGQVAVKIQATGYRDETVSLSLSSKQNIAVKMVPANKAAFISKRNGTYDIYKVDLDGKNEQLVLKGTGNEQSNLTFAPHPSGDAAMLITSRDGNHDTDGSLLTDVTFVNLKDGTTKRVAESPAVRSLGWAGTRFIYVQTTTGAKPDDPARDKLMSYDYLSGDNRQLASSNYFNDVVLVLDKVYYAPSTAYQNGVNTGMFVVAADGSGKQPVFNKEVWTIARIGYDHFALAVQQDWYDYVIGGQPTKLNGQPSDTTSRLYVDSPDGKNSAWLDTRDGKGTIVLYDTTTKTEKTLYAQANVKGPLRWVSNTVLEYRVVSSTETADYIVSISGGSPQKLSNVTDSKGIERYTY